MIDIECPFCKRRFQAPDVYAGSEVRCRGCGKPIALDPKGRPYAGQTDPAAVARERSNPATVSNPAGFPSAQSNRLQEVDIGRLPDDILSIQEFFLRYKGSFESNKTLEFHTTPDFPEKAKRRIADLLSGSSAPAVAYAKKKHPSQEVIFLEDSIVLNARKAIFQERQDRLRIALGSVRNAEMKIGHTQAGPMGVLFLNDHPVYGLPADVMHLFAQLVARISSAPYNVARFSASRAARSRVPGAQADLLRKWRMPLLKVLPPKSRKKISATDFGSNGFAGIPWGAIADVQTYMNTDALSIVTSFRSGRYGSLRVLTVEGDIRTFAIPAKNLPLIEECIKELAGIYESGLSGGPAKPASPDSLIEAGKSKSRAVGFSVISLGIAALSIGAVGGAERFGPGPFALGFIALVVGTWRVIRP